MDKEERDLIEQTITEQAKRLDNLLCRLGKSNGIVSSKNFSLSGQEVYLQGKELAKVGTGYIGTGETVVEKIVSLVDSVFASFGGKVIVSKAEDDSLKVEKEQKKEAEKVAKKSKKEIAPKGEPDLSIGKGKKVSISEDVTVSATESAKSIEEMTVSELKEQIKEKGASIPRGATKAELIEILLAL